MLDIKALEAAFARISEIGKGEIRVEVDGLDVHLRTLTPEEDVEVQRFARGENVDEFDNITLIERFKRATIGYAVVQVGDLNLRGVRSIPTGESLPNGTLVRVPKHEAVRRITETWSRHGTTLLFQQYAELVKRVEDDANSRVKFDTAKVDAEIERLESRLSELRRMQTASVVPTSSADVMTSLMDADSTLSQTAIHPVGRTEVSDRQQSNPQEVPQPPVQEAQAQVRQRVTPQEAPPPPRPQVQPQVQADTSDLTGVPASEVRNSVGDFSLEDIAAEEARIHEVRSRRAATAAQGPDQIPVNRSPRPPHLAAREVAEEVAMATQEEPRGGIETYRMPTANLTDRGRGVNVPPVPGRAPAQRNAAPVVNQAPSGGPTNPNFRGGSGR